MVATILAASSRMIASPAKIACMPKKTIDQRVLSTSWTAKTATPGRTAVLPGYSRTTRKREIPIRIYNAAQTGAKTQAGGVITGLVSAAYHDGMFGWVTSEPIIPANRETATEMTRRSTDRDGIFFIR
jgi:hypothetical protein